MADLQTSVAVTDAALVTTDVTTNDASTTKHGFLKKLDNVATNFMNGQGSWAAPATASATSASSVAALGAASDGKIGLIRAGSTPFDFVVVVYDATYAKWVSADEVVFSYGGTGGSGRFTTTSATYVDAFNDYSRMGPKPWKTLDTAGLTPQFRLIGEMADGSGTATAQTAYKAADAGSILNNVASVAVTGTMSTASATFIVTDTGWIEIVAGYTVKDFILPIPQLKDSAAGTAYLQMAVIRMRWVG